MKVTATSYLCPIIMGALKLKYSREHIIEHGTVVSQKRGNPYIDMGPPLKKFSFELNRKKLGEEGYLVSEEKEKNSSGIRSLQQWHKCSDRVKEPKYKSQTLARIRYSSERKETHKSSSPESKVSKPLTPQYSVTGQSSVMKMDNLDVIKGFLSGTLYERDVIKKTTSLIHNCEKVDMEKAFSFLKSIKVLQQQTRLCLTIAPFRSTIAPFGAYLSRLSELCSGKQSLESLGWSVSQVNKEIDNIMNIINELNIIPDKLFCQSMLNIYLETNQFEKATSLIIGSENKSSLVTEWDIQIDIQSYNTYILICAKNKKTECAERVLRLLINNFRSEKPNKEILPNHFTCKSLLELYVQSELFEPAKRLILGDEKIQSYRKEWKLNDDIFYYNLFIQICAKTKNYEATQEVISIINNNLSRKSPLKSVFPNDYTCANLLTAYAETKSIESAKELLLGCSKTKSYISKWNIRKKIIFYSLFFSVCEKSANYDAAAKVFLFLIENERKYHPNKEIMVNTTTLCNFLMVCARTKHLYLAKRIMMGGEGKESYLSEFRIRPNIQLWGAFMSVCAETGSSEDGMAAFEGVIKDARSEPPKLELKQNRGFFISSLKFCIETRKVELANQIIFGIKGKQSYISEFGVPIDIHFYCHLLSVYTKAQYSQIIEATTEIFSILVANSMKDQPNKKILPNDVVCVLLMNIFGKYQLVKEADKLVFGIDEQSYIDLWGLGHRYTYYMDWALANIKNFDNAVQKLCKKGICYEHLGLAGNEFNCHIRDIFKIRFPEKTDCGVLFEFAKALYEYHCSRRGRKTITKIVTGKIRGTSLKDNFVNYLTNERNLRVSTIPTIGHIELSF